MSSEIYHERQVRELCALHVLNNLFQKKGHYTKSQLDEICKHLSPDEWINPHKSIFGLGNYDINVLMTALQIKKCEAVWFDKRKDPICINTDHIIGFILNVPTEYKLGFINFPLKRRHWIAIRKLNGSYWNLDSKLEEPLRLGNEEDLMEFLRTQLASNDKELFIVIEKEVEQSQTWLNNHENERDKNHK